MFSYDQILELQIGITANSFSLMIDWCVDDDTELILIKLTKTYGSDLFLLVSTAARSLHCLMLMSRLPETML